MRINELLGNLQHINNGEFQSMIETATTNGWGSHFSTLQTQTKIQSEHFFGDQFCLLYIHIYIYPFYEVSNISDFLAVKTNRFNPSIQLPTRKWRVESWIIHRPVTAWLGSNRSAGSFLGPTLGGELSELIGVRSTYTYMGALGGIRDSLLPQKMSFF